MKIILTENVRGLGQIGDTKEVKNGYGRNFLMPKGLAIPATAENLNKVGELKNKKALAIQQEIEKMKQTAEKLRDFRLVIETKADEKGHLYAAVNSKKISEALREKGIEVSADYLEVAFDIKKVGVHPALFKYYDAEASFEVEIVSA